jgi:arginase
MSAGFNLEEMKPWTSKLQGFSWLTPRVKAKHLAYIGLRDVETQERKAIEMFDILAFSSKEVSSLGIDKVVDLALESICPGGKRPLHVSFDIDTLDDLEVKSTGTPVPGGLTLREGLTMFEKFYEMGNLVSLDITEVNPAIGSKADVERVAAVTRQLILSIFGYYRGGVSNKPFPEP